MLGLSTGGTAPSEENPISGASHDVVAGRPAARERLLHATEASRRGRRHGRRQPPWPTDQGGSRGEERGRGGAASDDRHEGSRRTSPTATPESRSVPPPAQTRAPSEGGPRPLPETRRPNWHQPSVQILTLPPRAATSGIVADILVDTDIFIDHLRGMAELKPARHRLHYSVITRAELFAGGTGTDLATRVLAPFREIPVDRPIAERSGSAGSADPGPSPRRRRGLLGFSEPSICLALSRASTVNR